MKTNIIIPARKGSKGFPHKNRFLVPALLEKIINCGFSSTTILSTNDPVLQELGESAGLQVRYRPEELSKDNVSMKSVLMDIVDYYDFQQDETVLTLYPTYPERTEEDIRGFLEFFNKNDLNSALCKKDIKTHPYLCLVEDGIYSRTLIDHDLYRRQDYPRCFEVSHFLCGAKVFEIKNLNNQLHNNETGFYHIADKVDVDYENDYNIWRGQQNEEN